MGELALGATFDPRPLAGRRLCLRNANTGETFNGCYRDASGPIPGAMAELRHFLRDYHSNTLGPLDPSLIDLLADVMAASGQSAATVLSGYRTPKTNALLAATTFGVAENSQHIYGRAIDVTFDHRLLDAEKAARAMQRGGVGWYPRAHFVHLDTGPVRHWELGGHGLGKIPRGSVRTVADRHALHRALAHRQYVARH
jgi:uncharacterized protein YcbK (DUF882 family)